MLWIGLTGGIASGKSTATKVLRDLGYSVVDADELAKKVVTPGTPGFSLVKSAFGEQIILPDGSLDRKKIANLVFTNVSELRKLESIIHPLVQKEVEELRSQFEKSGQKIAFYDVPLLFESNLVDNFDFTILISCDELTQKARLKSRNNMSEEEIKIRLKNQIPLKQKESKSDFVVQNNGSQEELKDNLKVTVQKILQKA